MRGLRGLSVTSLQVLAAAAVVSFILYAALAIALRAEPWDSLAYLPLLALLTAIATFARPRAAVLTGLAIVCSQWLGWLAVTALSETQSLVAWPLVVFFTLPLFVIPRVTVAAVAGATGRYLCHRLWSLSARATTDNKLDR
jgi:hypothetical protein